MASATAQLSADDCDYFDARLAQQRVCVDIAVVGKDNTRRGTNKVRSAIPSCALAQLRITASVDDAQFLQSQGRSNNLEQRPLVFRQLEAAIVTGGAV